jgi:hypothetical protein
MPVFRRINLATNDNQVAGLCNGSQQLAKLARADGGLMGRREAFKPQEGP